MKEITLNTRSKVSTQKIILFFKKKFNLRLKTWFSVLCHVSMVIKYAKLDLQIQYLLYNKNSDSQKAQKETHNDSVV